MTHLNIEIKARCSDHDNIRKVLKEKNAEFKGCDHQTDTYFKVDKGRLKIREGNIEHNLIWYEREGIQGPKKSSIILMRDIKDSPIKDILKNCLIPLVIVDKKREIYFIDNIKFHIDIVNELGTFVEIEAIDYDNTIGVKKLTEQVNEFIEIFRIKKEDLLSDSYSDILMKK